MATMIAIIIEFSMRQPVFFCSKGKQDSHESKRERRRKKNKAWNANERWLWNFLKAARDFIKMCYKKLLLVAFAIF